MKTNFRNFFTTITLLFVIGLSAFITVPAYADEATPEAPVVSEETVEVTDQESAEEETLPPTPEVGTESETSDLTESVESIIESLPEDTGLVVLDEEGEALPLASEEAAQAIIVGDPIWCPASVAVPTPNLNGCSGSYATFAALFGDPIFTTGGGVGPAMDGIIWVEKTYAGEGLAINISGSSYTTMKDFKLTIKGGWNGLGTGTVDVNDDSVFDAPLSITGWNNSVTLSDITITGSSLASSYTLEVVTTGAITVTRVNVNNNTDGGARFDNVSSTISAPITVTDSDFSNNASGSEGLYMDSKGAITLKNVTANGNASYGIFMYGNNATKAITLTNVTTNNNGNAGLKITSLGAITITDLTANSNVQFGADLNNLTGIAGITLAGTNIINSNANTGLFINSNGAVKLSNIHAVDNAGDGLYIDNDDAAIPQVVSVTGSNTFKFNATYGLQIFSDGQITLNNIIANSNGVGTQLDNQNGTATSGITLTGINQFNANASTGLIIYSTGTVLLNNITANNTTSGDGVAIDNTFSTTFKGVTIAGTNTFNNNGDQGLYLLSEGVITVSNITAISNNSNTYAVLLSNLDSGNTTPKAVTITGTNVINENEGPGLRIASYGAVTTNNITASLNGLVELDGTGVNINNYLGNATIASPITMNGTNIFDGNYGEGVTLESFGNIKVNNLTALNSFNSNGAYIVNAYAGSTGSVTLTGTNKLTGNQGGNLYIESFGAISINNLNASNSDTSFGASIYNNGAATAKPITLTGTNVANSNGSHGISIGSIGIITINNLTANFNTSSYGANISNTSSVTPMNVSLNGNNNFNGNQDYGLFILTKGSIKINNLTANENFGSGANGAYLLNTSGNVATSSVTLTGANQLSGNNSINLQIDTKGAVTINNLTASNSVTGSGANIQNAYDQTAPKPVTLTGTNIFNNNDQFGLFISSYGVITTNNLTAIANGLDANQAGVRLDNSNALPTKPVAVIMKGNNYFAGNYGANLLVYSLGAITVNNVTANTSVNSGGAFLYNNIGAGTNVTLTGTNNFISNGNVGLTIYSKGAITISNLTTSNNGSGAELDNTDAGATITNKPITLTGYVVVNGNTGSLSILSYSAVVTNNVTAQGNTGTGVSIVQDFFDSITPTNITMNGVNTFSGNTAVGLNISSLGTVTLNNITASNNSFIGVSINTTDVNATGAVIINGTNTFSNNNVGLDISANGAVTLNNITATYNNGSGVNIVNNYGVSMPKPVKITGTNTFSNNTSSGDGLSIVTYGAVSLNNVTANNNDYYGVYVGNYGATTPANVTFTGKNQFNSNAQVGIYISTHGNITLSNITANTNGSYGAYLNQNFVGATGSVTITGVNSFTENSNEGLFIYSAATVTLSKITADGNTGNGISINTTNGNVKLTCVSTINNSNYGLNLNVSPSFVATITGLVSAGNTAGPTFFGGGGTITQVYGCPLP